MNRTMDELKAFVLFMKEQGAYKFTIGDVSVEFGIGIDTPARPVMTIDDDEERAQQMRDVLRQAMADEQADLTWST